MISIVKKKNKIKRELLSKIEWACSLNAIKLSKEDISNIDNSLYVSLGLMKNVKKYEEKIENLNKYIEKLKENQI